jgi:hypothetical protein
VRAKGRRRTKSRKSKLKRRRKRKARRRSMSTTEPSLQSSQAQLGNDQNLLRG